FATCALPIVSFFFQAEDGIRDRNVTGVQTCALPILLGAGDAAFLRTITVGSVIIGFLPGIWIAYALDFGLAGIWAGLAAFILLRTVAVVFRFYSMRWAVVS